MLSINKIVTVIMALFFAQGHAQEWKTNFEEAKTVAQKEDKNILLVFSGSDWCAPCIKLDKNIWQSVSFIADAKNSWVLVKADFPKKKSNELPEELKKQNDVLFEKYNKEGSFPLVVVLDKTGKVLGKTSFKNISAEAYIALLHSFEKK